MDHISEKDEFSQEKMDTLSYDSLINPPMVSSSCSQSQMVDSYGQTLWYDHTNVQAYGGFDASSPSSFRGLEMGWNLPTLLPPNGGGNNGLFLPNAGSFLPPSMAHIPADSGFIERAARFSLFGGMVNQPPLGNQEPVGLFLQGGGRTMQGQRLSNELNVGEAHVDVSKVMRDPTSEQGKPCFLGPGNVSGDTQSSGGNGRKSGETSSKGFDSKKRKRNRQNLEADQPLDGSKRFEEESDNDEQSPNSQGNKTNSGKQTYDLPKDGYIHVRARRGQATNSHSLAERVRREKISERMKFLQDLVPGCDKVTGKAVMLDEIINYVESLQRQVEFLSMKLATVNPQMDFNLEGLLAKDARANSSSVTPFHRNVSTVYPPLPHVLMQQNISNIVRTSPLSPPPMNGGFKRQVRETNGWEGDLQNVIHSNYGAGDDVTHDPQATTTASNEATNMKVEP
ncbi:unnamed protein product [Cochlearia groenlandica]